MSQRPGKQTAFALMLIVLAVPLLMLFLLANRPRGPYIVYQVSERGSHTTPAQIYMTDIRRSTTQKLSVGTTWDERPAVSPDGRHIAYQRRESTDFDQGALYIMEIATRRARLVLDTGGGFSNQVWSPDGRQLAFAWRSGDGEIGIHIVDVTGDNLRTLFPADLRATFPAWSSDGSQIAFSARTGQWVGITDFNQGYVTSLESGETRQIMSMASNAPVWSPGGRYIALSAWLQYADSGNIYIIDTQTDETRQLTRDLSTGELTWSPDGSRIVFVARSRARRHDRNAADLYVIDADGGNLRRLTVDLPMPPFQLTWSPDGEYLAYYSYDDDSGDVYLLHIASGGIRNLTNMPPGHYASSPGWRR
jgi:Tol biopolymer transport system component